MTYAGLTISDKPALLEAKARGAEWVARDQRGSRLWIFEKEPQKLVTLWACDPDHTAIHAMEIDSALLSFIQWSDAEPVNISLALAQIAEMESDQSFRAMLPIYIDRANEHIAEMESAEKPEAHAFFSGEQDVDLGDVFICAACGKRIYGTDHKFCSGCGRKITFDDDQQIAEKPMTWDERINQMTVEEKAESLVNGMLDEFWAKSIDDTFMSNPKSDEEYHALRKAMWIKFLASPYTEGEKV